MRTITLQSLQIENFKGIKARTIDFSQMTFIKAQNEKGKTTIFDAFTWLLFGKDSAGNKKFGWKPHETDRNLENYGQERHNLSTSVTAIFYVDGSEVKLKKVSEENWVKKKGQGDRVYQGNVLTCSCDDITKKTKEFEAIVNDLVDEDIFRLLTDPMYFSRQHWEDQRKIVLDVVGEPSFDDVVSRKPKKLEKLREIIGKHSIEDLKKKLKGQIRTLKDSVDKLPARIDEALKSVADNQLVPLEMMNETKQHLTEELDNLQEQLADRSKGNESKQAAINALIDKQAEVRRKAQKVERDQRNEIQDKIDEASQRSNKFTSSIRQKEARIVSLKKQIESLEKSKGDALYNMEQKEEERAGLAGEWSELKKKAQEEIEQIQGMESLCPICGQVLPEDQAVVDREKRIQESRKKSKRKIEAVNQRGKALKEEIDRIKFSLSGYDDQIEACKVQKTQCRQEITDETEWLNEAIADRQAARGELEAFEAPKEVDNAQIEINVLQSRIDEMRSEEDDSTEDIKLKIQKKMAEINDCNADLTRHEMNEKQRKRVAELQEEQKTLSDELTKLEGFEFLCDQYIIEKVHLLEDRVREMFGGVEFKLFNQQINGGVTPTCEVLVKGVPWGDANNGHKIVSGIKIINALSEHYEIQVPVFIDNREAVNDCNVPDIKSQSIHLFVTEDPELVVEVA